MRTHAASRIVGTLVTLILLSGCASPPLPEPRPEPVKEVKEVAPNVLESHPRQLKITATGNVPSGGWTNPHLRPHVYVQMPPDGIYGYDFLATRPDGPAPTVMTSVTATLTIIPIPDGLKGVRVDAKKNQKIALLE